MVLAFLALVVGLLLTVPNGTEPRSPRPSPQSTSEVPDATPAELHGTTSTRSPIDGRAVAAHDHGPIRSSLLEGREVRVVVAASGEPAPGALVTWSPRPPIPDLYAYERDVWLEELLQEHDPEATLAAEGLTYRADSKGRLLLPAQQGVAMGRTGELWGLVALDGDFDEPAVLALEPDTSCSVTVLDATGAPASEVRVWLVEQDRDGGWTRLEASTGPNGEAARFPHLGARLPAQYLGDLESLGFMAVVADDDARPVTLGDQVPRSVVLRLPETGTLVLQAVDAQGRRVRRAGLKGQLALLGGSEAGFLSELDDFELLGVSDEEGELRVERVGLGVRVDATLAYPNGGGIDTTFARGPLAAGQEVVVPIPIATPETTLRMTLLHASGRPLADGDWVKLTVHYEGCERALASEEYAEIGPGGLLVYTFSGSDPRQVEGGRCDISITTGYSPETWTIRRAGPIRTGINELGVLRRSRAPVLAKGRVFHATGEPAGGIQVRARTPRESAGPDDRNKSAWVRITSSTTAPDGSFELRHEHEGSFVLAYSQLTIPARLREVRSGVEGLSLVLPETGAVTGSVRIPSGLDTIGFTAKFLSTPDIPDGPSADQGAPAPLVAVHKIEDDGSFLAPDLVPGTYRVELRADPWRAPFAAVDGVLVEAGETCRDPRLADIPLGNLDTHDLELVDTAGRPVPEGRVTWRALDDPPWRFRGTADFHDGRFVLYTDLEAVEVSVEAEHHHERTVAPIHADARIVLRAWQELAISLRPSLAEAFPQLDFELELAGPGEDPEDEPKGWDETIPAQGSRTWRVDRPGTWWAWLTCVDGGAEIEASIERPLRLEVLDTAEVQEFVLDVRVSDVAALLEATHDPD